MDKYDIQGSPERTPLPNKADNGEHCGGCDANCPLESPACMRGVRRALERTANQDAGQ